MASWSLSRRNSPIGVDIGGRSVKLVQLSADRQRLIDAARWDLPGGEAAGGDLRGPRLTEALNAAREGRHFHGRDAVVCLGARELFVQNVRVPKAPPGEFDQIVRQEAAGRIPFPVAEAEIRYLDAADVRQNDLTRREVIVLACHQPVLAELLSVVEAAGLRPVAVDVEPAALLRCYAAQFRRDEDKQQRSIYVHLGASTTAVVIAQGSDALFIKYVEIGGRHFDDAVAQHLKLDAEAAWSLRRHNGDRRADQQDPEVARSVTEALRGVLERLTHEVSLCIRYHSVTFRGQPLARLVLGGGEATQSLVDTLAARLNLKCELGEPLRSYEPSRAAGRPAQWDVAAGLALRETP
jgi:type IV pilus assembly protein PilM